MRCPRRPHRANDRVRQGLLSCLLLAAGPSAIAAAAPPPPDAASPQSRVFQLQRCGARETFELEDPSATSSAAVRLCDDARQTGFVVHGRLVLRLAEDQVELMRVRAGSDLLEPIDGAPDFWLLTLRSVSAAIERCDQILDEGRAREAYLDIQSPRVLRGVINDPGFAQQWHLSNIALPLFDINVEPAWTGGFTGAGITVGVVEGGFEVTHPDLSANYNAAASQSAGLPTFHGTSVAGVIGAVANNSLGGAGVAWGAKISKQIYGAPSTNAAALGFRNDLNAIKNNSWGPADNGVITYITSVELAALKNAAQNGRGGRGTILTWAAGNGGTADRVDYDPYASSRYVLPIGGIGDMDTRSSFNESGSAMFMVAPTSGNARSIYTTDYTGVNGFSTGDYTDTFGGTSSAAPLAAGAIACILQANPLLSWRDVQHVLIETARRCDPLNPGWAQNGAGRWVSYDYGYGAVDLGAAVAAAPQWINVRPEVSKPTSPQIVGLAIPDNNPAGITRSLAVAGTLRVETVEVTVNVSTTNIGDLQIVLTSPAGSTSVLAAAPRADSQDNLNNYVFTSRRHWGEDGGGPWTLRIADRRAGEQATWISWSLGVFGSPCPADMDGSGFVDTDDYDLFIQLFQAGSMQSDIDRSGFVDLEDFDRYVRAFEKGC